jgi:hypothetical protein
MGIISLLNLEEYAPDPVEPGSVEKTLDTSRVQKPDD